MYKGLASLVGMDVLTVEGEEDALDGKVQALRDNWSKYDFFYFHVKKTDSTGEDGDFKAKVKKIELFDALLPQLLALNPDVIAIVGDHSTPASSPRTPGTPSRCSSAATTAARTSPSATPKTKP